MTEPQQIDYEGQGSITLEAALGKEDLTRAREAFAQAERDGGLEDLPNWDDFYIRLAEHPAFFPTVHRIIGDDVQVRSLRGVCLPPGSKGRGWHREVGGILGVHHPGSTLYLQVTLCLDDTPEEGARISFVPGSHRFKQDLPFPSITRIEEMPHHVAPRVPAGTAVILNGNLWQARTSNRSGATQRFLEYTYIHCWMRQALPILSSHSAEVASSTHNLSQLFGIRTDPQDARWYWGRRVEGYPPSTGLPDRRFAALKVVGRGVKGNE